MELISEHLCIKRINSVSRSDILMSPSKSNLSQLSQSIIDSFNTKKVIAIFAQGPLNLTPLISAMHAAQGQDVLVSLPSVNFDQTYNKYTQEFFSILYTNSTQSFAKSQFFYNKILWGTAKIKDDDEPFTDFDVEKKPIHGMRQFQKNYEMMMDQLLRSGKLNFPKIVFVKTKDFVPAGAIGKKNIRFKEDDYGCLEHNPTLIILESINERRVSYEGLLAFTKAAVSQGRKVILHFSWPYLEDLDNFISDLERDHGDQFSSLHLGKRICLEMAREMESSPPPYALALSLENNLWESGYYSTGDFIDQIEMIVPAGQQIEGVRDLRLLEDSIDTLDEAQNTILDEIGALRQQHGFTIGLLLNPPIVDSVATPSESMINAYVEQVESWRYIPLHNYIEKVLGPGNSLAGAFGRMAADLERCRDLTAELNGIKTPIVPRKKTVLQFILLDELAKAVKSAFWENSRPEVGIVLSDYHPMFVTRNNVVKNIDDELDAIKNLCKMPQPIISHVGDNIELAVEGQNTTIFEGGRLIGPDREQLELLRRKLQYPNAYITATSINNQLRVEAGFVINCSILRVKPTSGPNMELKRNLRFPIFSARVSKSGDYEVARVKTIKVDNSILSSEIRAEIKYEHSGGSRLSAIPIRIHYQRPDRVQYLSRDTVEHSILIMPGPMPYFSLDDDSVSMAKGYDCVMLPFKRVIFLAYPGRNCQMVRRQLERLADLYSEEHNQVSAQDLNRSLTLTRRAGRINLPTLPEGISSPKSSRGITPIDEVIRETREISTSSLKGKEIVSLKELWERIETNSRRSTASSSAPREESISRSDQLSWLLDFSGSVETFSFTRGTYIRARDGDKYVLKMVDELVPGDEILYFDSIERESVDNHLLRKFLEDSNITLEQVLEPIRCLSLFYTTLRSITIWEPYDPDLMKNLYWLNDKSKRLLYRLIQMMQGDECTEDEVEEIMDYGIWSKYLDFDDLVEISNYGGPEISYKKLFMVAKRLGLTLKESTFTQLFFLSRNDGTHWLFRSEENLRAIARLIGHDYLVEHYEEVNEMGRRVATVLTMIGQCISRVASGRGELTEMDLEIEGKLKKGIILREG